MGHGPEGDGERNRLELEVEERDKVKKGWKKRKQRRVHEEIYT